MVNNYKLNENLRLYIVIVLIFSIVFVNEIDLFKSKIVYYFMCLIFLMNVLINKKVIIATFIQYSPCDDIIEYFLFL